MICGNDSTSSSSNCNLSSMSGTDKYMNTLDRGPLGTKEEKYSTFLVGRKLHVKLTHNIYVYSSS